MTEPTKTELAEAERYAAHETNRLATDGELRPDQEVESPADRPAHEEAEREAIDQRTGTASMTDPVIATQATTGEIPAIKDEPHFLFDGGAGSHLGVAIFGLLITVLTLGLGFPFAVVMREKWKAKHTYVAGRRLQFTGSGLALLGRWIVWELLIIVTVGIYLFWLMPALTRWKVEHTRFDPAPIVPSQA